MGFIDRIKARAKTSIKTIVLPESEDRRTYEAAAAVLKEGTAKLIIIGSPEEIAKKGAGCDLTGASFVDPATYEKTPEYIEKLFELRQKKGMVCEPALAFCAREISLEKFLLLGKGEEQTGGRTRDSITSDALEALIGAIYLDGGFEPAKAFIEKFILTDVEDKQLFYDSKTVLQEMVQAEGARTLQYIPAGEEGPDHNKTFTAKAALDGSVISVGRGKTKKAAEQDAAYQAILKLRERK